MKCPRCETAALLERDREGLTLDFCPSCRGLWLDRGELEKLLARAAADYTALESATRPPPPPPTYPGYAPTAARPLPSPPRRHDDSGPHRYPGASDDSGPRRHPAHRDDSGPRYAPGRRDDSGPHRYDPRYGRPPHKKRWFDALGDLFD